MSISNKITIYSNNLRFGVKIFVRKPRYLLRVFKAYIKVLLTGRTPLRFVDIAVSYDCNFSCSHCSASAMRDRTRPPLTVEEYKRIAEDFMSEGALVFHFTGGEPIIHPQLEEIIRAFRPDRNLISVQTNGYAVNEGLLRRLRAAGVDTICVSIDSSIPEEHDLFRRKPNSHARAIEALKTAGRLGFNTVISLCVSHDSLMTPGFIGTCELARETGSWCIFNLAVPAGNWRGSLDKLLTPEDRRTINEYIRANPHCRTDFESNFISWGCGAIKEKLYLGPTGEVLPCPFIQITFGNVRQDPVAVIRGRGLDQPFFRKYHHICPPAEDREFLETALFNEPGAKTPVEYSRVFTS